MILLTITPEFSNLLLPYVNARLNANFERFPLTPTLTPPQTEKGHFEAF